MTDTIQIRPGDVLVPPSAGDNTTETYGVWYPYDGLFVPSGTGGREAALADLAWARANEGAGDDLSAGALALKVTLERIDP